MFVGRDEWLSSNVPFNEFVVVPNCFQPILEIAVGATLVVAQDGACGEMNYVTQIDWCAQTTDGTLF